MYIKGHSILDTKKFNTYFKKLHIKPNTLSLDLIEKIQTKHLATFSFNNISVLLNKPLSLEIDDIIEKIVDKNLGGYCFEHNKLIHHALASLGFDVRISIARVLNNQNIDSPKTHRITLVRFKEEDYLIDVGFGLFTPNKPIKISSKNTTNNGYRIVQDKNKTFTLEVLKKKNYFKLYSFTLETYTESDCKMGNFYSEYFPDAVFQNNLVVSLKKDNKTFSFRNNCHHQILEKFTNILHIINPSQLKQLLKDDFNLKITKKESKILFEKAEIFKIA